MRRFLVVSGLAVTLIGCTGLVELDDGPGDAALPDAAIDAPEDGAAGPLDATADAPSDTTTTDADAGTEEAEVDAGDAAAETGAEDAASDAPTDANTSDGSVGPAVYGGGRVLLNASSLVRVYWGSWEPNTETDCENLLEPAVALGTTSLFAPITQYGGAADGGEGGAMRPIALPNFQYLSPRHAFAPADGGVGDPDGFVEGLAAAAGPQAEPDTIYVVFYTEKTPLCGGLDGCSGLTPQARIPYVRVQYDGNVVDSSRALVRELVDVITDCDGAGWTVPIGNRRYPLAGACSRATGGGGLGNEATFRTWDVQKTPVVFGTDGIYSALADDHRGRCVDSFVTQGVLAAVADGGAVSLFKAPGAVPEALGVPAQFMPAVTDVSVAASRFELSWHGVWAMNPGPGGQFTQAWPTLEDLTQTWGASNGGPLPAPYVAAYSMDTAMQGDARWDAFTVATVTAGDAGAPSAALFHASYDTSLASTEAWNVFDMTGLPGNPKLVSGPGAASFAPGRIDAFVLGAYADGNHLLHTWCDARKGGVFVPGIDCSAPMGWEDEGVPAGARLLGDPDAASWASGTTDQGHFAVACGADDGTVRIFRFDDGVTRWVTVTPPQGVRLQANPSIAGMGDDRYWIAALGNDGAVWNRLDDGSTAGSWVRSAIPGVTAIDLTAY